MLFDLDYNLDEKLNLPISFNKTELDDIDGMSSAYPDFDYRVVKNKVDYTQILFEELKAIQNSKFTRNFIINIKGLIGRQTGIFKSTLALQMAKGLDSSFNVKDRVAMTVSDLLKKTKLFEISSYSGEGMTKTSNKIYVLDEQVKDLKVRAEIQLHNIVVGCREQGFSLICVGATEANVAFSDYSLERLGESSDDLLPKKTVAFVVRKTIGSNKDFRGYIKWNVTPLTNPSWKKMWDEYMELKRNYQQRAVKQILTGMDIDWAKSEVIKNPKYAECLKDGMPVPAKLKNLIYKLFPDYTNDERSMIYAEIVPPEYFRVPSKKRDEESL